MVRKHSVTVTSTGGAGTASNGSSTSYVKGCILSVEYLKGATAFSATADLAITTVDTSHNILTSLAIGSANFLKSPRSVIVNTTNGAIANFAGLIPVDDERIKVTVTNSSKAAQTGTFNIYEQL